MILFFLACLCTTAFAQEKGTFTDSRDSKTYKWVKIGTQTWLAENLNYEAEGSKCYGEDGEVEVESDNDYLYKTLSGTEIQANCEKYGRLYDWNAAMKACPKGWHLPSDAEWETLVDFADGGEVTGRKFKAKSGWDNNGNGTDTYGFAALPGGFGDSNGVFDNVGEYGYWWSATEYDASIAYNRYIYAIVYRSNFDKTDLFSVRCLRN